MADLRNNPLVASQYHLMIGEELVASFKSVEGLSSETEVVTLMQSTKDGKRALIKVPGADRLKAGNFTAKYAAIAKKDPVETWRMMVVNGEINKARRNGTLVVYDVEGKEARRFNFLNMWPAKLSWSNLSTKSNETVDVTVVFEHEGMDIVSSGVA